MTIFTKALPLHQFDHKPSSSGVMASGALTPRRNRDERSDDVSLTHVKPTGAHRDRVAVEGQVAVARRKQQALRVRDVMSEDVISVSPNTSVREIAETMIRNRVSSVPVADSSGRLLGLVSDGDLARRVEIGTEPRRSWWQVIFSDAITASYDYVGSHGRKARDVMTFHPFTTSPDEPLHKVAEKMVVKRLVGMPVVRNGRVVGMLSRSDLVRMLAIRSIDDSVLPPQDEDAIQGHLRARIHSLPWSTGMREVNATVSNGIARIYGLVGSEAERRALQVVAENTPGVLEVRDHLQRARPFV